MPSRGLRDSGRPARRGRSGGCVRIQRVRLALGAAGGPVGSIDLNQCHPGSAEDPGKPRSVGASALNPDGDQFAERGQPTRQLLISPRCCRELSVVDLASDSIDDRSVVGELVRVDAAEDFPDRVLVDHRVFVPPLSVITGRHAPAGRGGQDSDGASAQAPIRSRRPSGRVRGSPEPRIDESHAKAVC